MSNNEDEPNFSQPSLLSVIADSAEVEIILIDKQNLHLYPEDV